MAGFFHMASIVGHRLPLGVLQSFVRWEPQTRRGLTETLEAWATADEGRLARRTAWHAGQVRPSLPTTHPGPERLKMGWQIIGLHHNDPENPAFWYLENSLVIFYATLSLYCYSVFVKPLPSASSSTSSSFGGGGGGGGIAGQENGSTKGESLALDRLEPRTSPHVTSWIDSSPRHHRAGRPSITGVPDLHARGAPDRILQVGSAMLDRFKVAGVAQMLGNVVKRFKEVGPHLNPDVDEDGKGAGR